MNRRKFISNIGIVGGSQLLFNIPFINKANSLFVSEKITVQQIIDRFIQDVPGGAAKETVDTIKVGSANTEVKSIVTTMFATIEVIKQTIAKGANFMIVHEPTFYNHEDKTEWLKNDEVFNYKYDLLTKNNITVWRCHDYVHRLRPEPVTAATYEQLEWNKYVDDKANVVAHIPTMPLQNVIAHFKKKLNIEKVRYIGDLNQTCKTTLLIPGAAGKDMHIGFMKQFKPDVLICGELSEWETAEYIRDARAMGNNIALIILGHAPSEEAGSEFMLQWLKKNYPSIPAYHIPSGSPLKFE